MFQIRKLREKRKMTRAELARRLGVAEVTVYKWECQGGKNPDSRRTPRTKDLRGIAKALGVTVDELLA